MRLVSTRDDGYWAFFDDLTSDAWQLAEMQALSEPVYLMHFRYGRTWVRNAVTQ